MAMMWEFLHSFINGFELDTEEKRKEKEFIRKESLRCTWIAS